MDTQEFKAADPLHLRLTTDCQGLMRSSLFPHAHYHLLGLIFFGLLYAVSSPPDQTNDCGVVSKFQDSIVLV